MNSNVRCLVARLAGATLILLSGSLGAARAEGLNFLLIIADDCTCSDLEAYGGQAKTPNLNQLAAEGLRFTHCYQAASMCSPTRHCLYTGLYPVKSGAYPNHTMAYPWVRSIAQELQPVGYATHLSGKIHVLPASVFPFEYSALESDGNPDPAQFEKVLRRAEETKQPFLFVAASKEPHSPWNKGDPSAYPPSSIELPPVLADTPATRRAFSRYLAEITYFDSQIGQLLALLDQSSLRQNTLVMVLSEQGNSFPFAKWTCYEAGLHSACIVKWPGKTTPGSVSDALIEYVDVVPTFLEVAGLKPSEILDGRSFSAILRDPAAKHKQFVFALQTTRGIINGADHFGIRSVRDERYRYIRNLTPEATFKNTETSGQVFRSWQRLADAGDEQARRLVHDYQHRSAEELYDCQADPWNQRNLIADPTLAGKLGELRAQLDRWMRRQGDEGQATEMKALERMPGCNPTAALQREESEP